MENKTLKEKIGNVKIDATAKVESIRNKRKTDIKDLKKEARNKAKAIKVKPVVVGTMKLDENVKDVKTIIENAFSMVVVRKDSKDGLYKAGDIIARQSVGAYLTPELEAEVKEIHKKAKENIKAVADKKAEDLKALNKEKNKAFHERVNASREARKVKLAELMKKDEERMAKKKAELKDLEEKSE